MTLSELITNYRTEHGLSQRQLASRCSLSTGYISLIEKEINPQTGKRMVPTLAVLNKLANGMGMTIDELFSVCDDMPVDISEKKSDQYSDKFRENLRLEFELINPRDFNDVPEALSDYREIESLIDSSHPLSLAEACSAADKMGTSVDGLVFGETEKTPTLVIEDERTIEFIQLFSQLTPAEQDIFLAQIKGVLASR